MSYAAYAAHGIRPDGRTFSHARPTTVERGVLTSVEGSASVRIGGTFVFAGVSAAPLSAAASAAAGLSNGIAPSLLDVRVTVSPGSSARARGARVGEVVERGRELSMLAHAVFVGSFAADNASAARAWISPEEGSSLAPGLFSSLVARVPWSGIVSLDSLAIAAAQAPRRARDAGDVDALATAATSVDELMDAAALLAEKQESEVRARVGDFWTLTVDVVVVSDDGCAEDGVILAAAAALADTRLPAVGTDGLGSGAAAELGAGAGKRVGVSALTGADLRRICLRAKPVASTFALLRFASDTSAPLHILLDPSVSNGEDLDAALMPPSSTGGCAGSGAATSISLPLDDGAGVRALASAHLTLVCDASERDAPTVLVARKLGGEAVPFSLLDEATDCAHKRAWSLREAFN